MFTFPSKETKIFLEKLKLKFLQKKERLCRLFILSSSVKQKGTN